MTPERRPTAEPEPEPSAAMAELISVAHRLADAARRAALPHFRQGALAIDDKSAGAGFDPVTVADREAEQAMRAILADARPDDGILGEEFEAAASRSGLTWVLDPIDGTRAFISGVPLWGVLIAVNDGERPVLGVIDQPYLGERYVGWREGARRSATRFDRAGAAPLRTRRAPALEQAILFATAPELFQEPDERAAFEHASRACRLTRYGTDCYGYAMVAGGAADLVIEAGLAPYDIQAPIALIEAAGGRVTDWEGGPAQHGGRVCAAGDHTLHAKALHALNAA
ncbi:MAG: histidinol-phosphatase [Pseudomonadota bacterium]